MVIELVSRWSLANHCDSGSFLVVCTSLSQGDSSEEDSGRLVRHVASPFDLFRILLVDAGLLVLCSLPRPPVIKQLVQMVIMVPGQGGWFQCASPNIGALL